MKVPTNTQQGNYSFSGDSDGKESACNAEALAWIPGLGRSLGEGNGYHSSIVAWRVPIDREAWWAIVHRVAKSWAQLKRLSTTLNEAKCLLKGMPLLWDPLLSM